jgi:very-short-patch-repair endonuclease
LCRLHGLPEPRRQAVRADRNGRKRYLDAEWVRERDRKRVVAEVDGALHLTVERWWEDQARQNEISLDGALVLRFPSIVIRTAEADVASQLRRALG